MSADVVVRSAGPADLAEITRMARSAHTELDHERGASLWFLREGRGDESALLADRGERALLGLVDDAPVGFAIAHLATLNDGSRLGVITELYVEPDGREVGVGDALIVELVEQFRAEGAIGVDSWALPGARLTKNFYEAHHFTARALILHHRFR